MTPLTFEIFEMYEGNGIWCWGHVPPGHFVKAAREAGYDGLDTAEYAQAYLRPTPEGCTDDPVGFDSCDTEEPGTKPVTYMVF